MLNVLPALEVSPALIDLSLILHFTPTHISLTSFVAAGMYGNGVFTHLWMCCGCFLVCVFTCVGLAFVEKCLVTSVNMFLVRLETEREFDFI
jgi:hypothetical protein